MPAKKTNIIINILEKIVVPLLTALIGAGMTYFVTTYEKAPPPQTEVPIESMPVHIFAFAGNNNPEGGWSVMDVYYTDNLPSYNFTYALPTDGKTGYAGMTFKFEQGADLSEFESVAFLLTIPPNEEADLLVKDIAGKELRYRVRGGPQAETKLEISLSNFKDVNLKAVREVMFFVDTGFVIGDHAFSVKEMKFLR